MQTQPQIHLADNPSRRQRTLKYLGWKDRPRRVRVIDEPAYTQNYHSDCLRFRWNVAAYPGPAIALNLAAWLAPNRFSPPPRSL
jgi:hypothetical protein